VSAPLYTVFVVGPERIAAILTTLAVSMLDYLNSSVMKVLCLIHIAEKVLYEFASEHLI
jgi:hypothetical protein